LSGHTGNGLNFLKPNIHLNNHEKLLPKRASNFCEGAVLVPLVNKVFKCTVRAYWKWVTISVT
jgi:hypothetical protein